MLTGERGFREHGRRVVRRPRRSEHPELVAVWPFPWHAREDSSGRRTRGPRSAISVDAIASHLRWHPRLGPARAGLHRGALDVPSAAGTFEHTGAAPGGGAPRLRGGLHPRGSRRHGSERVPVYLLPHRRGPVLANAARVHRRREAHRGSGGGRGVDGVLRRPQQSRVAAGRCRRWLGRKPGKRLSIWMRILLSLLPKGSTSIKSISDSVWMIDNVLVNNGTMVVVCALSAFMVV